MKLVLLADLHDAATDGVGSRRMSVWATLILKRAVRRLNRFLKPDLVVFAGDLLENGCAPDALERYRTIRSILDALQMPWIALPGNHDAPPDVFYQVFPKPEDKLDLQGIRWMCFLDPSAPHWSAVRLPEDLARSAAAGEGWNGPIIALQHVPLFLPGTVPCPYNYENAEKALQTARKGGISLILSGHYHAGFSPVTVNGITSVSAPALCEAPFQFLEIEFHQGKLLRVIPHALRMPEGLCLPESHVHTELAYCADDISVSQALSAGKLFSASPLCFSEHTGQLYFDKDTFWSARFMANGLETVQGRQNRMRDYFECVASCGLSRKRIGFEVDFDHRGRMVLQPEDRALAGFLLGSYHWTPESAARSPFDPQVCAERLRVIWESMLCSGIDVLAHPFRMYGLTEYDPPPELFRDLAGRLAKAGVAAELNYHNEEPYPEFVRACLDAGVRFSFGTDSHSLVEVCEFWPHLQLLRGMGVRDSDLDQFLWRPDLSIG